MIARLARRAIAAVRGATPDYLGAQVARSAAKERIVLDRLGIRGAIADIGCGPGHFTALLAGWYPAATIVAIEPDPAMRAAAGPRLAALPGVRLVAATAEATGIASATLDTVVARLVFQHLADPAAALREAWRVLRPGGRLIVIDADDRLFGTIDPPVPEVATAVAAFGAAQTARGGARDIGGRLPALLDAAGFVEVDVDPVATRAGAGHTPLPHLDDAPLDFLVRAGALAVPTRAALAAARPRLAAATAILVTLVVHGRKPVSGKGPPDG